MAYLTKCSLCGRDVSSECNSCPGCGHNVAKDVLQKEFEKKPLKDRIVGHWKPVGGIIAGSNRDLALYENTYVIYFADGSIQFSGRYSISGDRINWISCDQGILSGSRQFSLKGDTLSLYYSDGRTPDTYQRR